MHSARRAFSLLELLVSMGVLVVLIGVLLPALHNAVRISTPLVRCSNNLSQLYRSISLYLMDSQGLMPAAQVQPLLPTETIPRLDKTLAQYGAGPFSQWLCPLDPRQDQPANCLSSYVYPVSRLQQTGQRIYLSMLPQQFPIFNDRVAFHLMDKEVREKYLLAAPTPRSKRGIDEAFQYNPGPGFNRVMSNGKITAFPRRESGNTSTGNGGDAGQNGKNNRKNN